MTFQSGDIVTSKSVKTYLEQERDGFTLWNPYVFGGMPAYALSVGYKWFNLIYVGLDAYEARLAVRLQLIMQNGLFTCWD